MTRPARRVTRFRTARHFRRDPLDYGIAAGSLGAIIILNLSVTPRVLELFWPVESPNAWLTAVLICTTGNLVIGRVAWLFGQHVIRRWLFDREQRRHEIVPPSERRITRA